MEINKVDIVRFEDKSESELVKILLICQHSSHLLDVLGEAKESVIY